MSEKIKIFEIPNLIIPEDQNTKIWRYMDTIKFLSLLEDESLYFSRSDKLGDPFEGSVTKKDFEKRKLTFKNEGKTNKMLKKSSKTLESVKYDIYINCWHVSEMESIVMWNMYAKNNYGIAIQTDFKSLKNCLEPYEPNIRIGMVKYLDYSKEFSEPNLIIDPYFCKRKSFEHEKELRAINWDPFEMKKSENKIGKKFDVDLEKLVKKVHIYPGAQDWILDTISDLINSFNFNFPVTKSEIDSDAIF